MTPTEVLHILRRRWYVVAVAVLIGFVAGYVTAPGTAASDATYQATTTLITNPTVASPQQARSVNLDQAALLVTAGEVPERVAGAMDLPVASVISGVAAIADPEIASLSITAVGTQPRQVEERVRRLSEELINRLSEGDREAYDDALAAAQERVGELDVAVDLLQAKVGPNPALADATDIAELEAAVQDLAAATSARNQLQLSALPTDLLIVVDDGTARPVSPDGIRPPDDEIARGLLLGSVGFVAGIVGAIALDRMDTRMRTRAQMEHSLGVPVLAEIPPLPVRQRSKPTLLAHTDTSSPIMEAYRGVRTALALEVGHDNATRAARPRSGRGGGTVVLITSAGPEECKSTTAAHLAAALAEVGRSVLLVGADFRRPRVHEFYGVPREPGLTDLLREPTTSLKDLMVSTPIPGVRMLPSGAPVENPAPLLDTVSELLAAAKQVFDFVVVDTAPVLAASDALGLLPVADEVILLARAGRTTDGACHRLAEVMRRLDAPVLGSVLVGVRRPSTSYYYRSSAAGHGDDMGPQGRIRPAS